MRIDEIEVRKAEIAAACETPEADLDALTEELRSLNAEIETIKAEAEKRAAIREAVADGDGEIIDNFKEERKMEDMIYSVESREYRNAYLKNLFNLGVDETEKRSLTSAAAVIPTQMVNDVIGKLKEAPILGFVAISNFPNYVRFPRIAASAAAAAAAIGSSITEGTNTLSYVDLTPNEYTKAISLQSDIQNMSIDALYTWLVDNITAEIRAKIAADVLVGNGTGCCKGIAASVQANASNLSSTVSKANLLKVMGTLDAAYHSNAIWVMTPNVFYEEVMSNTGLNDYVITQGFETRLFGHPVVLMSEALISTKETIFFGDPYAYKLNLFTALEIKPFEVATSLTTTYRGGCLADGELVDTAAFVRFAKA